MPPTYDNYGNDDNYSNDTWTTLVAGPGMVSNVLMSNIGGTSVSVELRVLDTSVSPPAAVFSTPARVLEVGDIDALDKGIALGADDEMQFRADLAGLSIIASAVSG